MEKHACFRTSTLGGDQCFTPELPCCCFLQSTVRSSARCSVTLHAIPVLQLRQLLLVMMILAAAHFNSPVDAHTLPAAAVPARAVKCMNSPDFPQDCNIRVNSLPNCIVSCLNAATGEEECACCMPGRRLLPNKECEPCPTGTFARMAENVCSPCREGTITIGPGSNACGGEWLAYMLLLLSHASRPVGNGWQLNLNCYLWSILCLAVKSQSQRKFCIATSTLRLLPFNEPLLADIAAAFWHVMFTAIQCSVCCWLWHASPNSHYRQLLPAVPPVHLQPGQLHCTVQGV
jgi:hypothetical protein